MCRNHPEVFGHTGSRFRVFTAKLLGAVIFRYFTVHIVSSVKGIRSQRLSFISVERDW